MLNCAIPAEVKGDRRILFYFFDHRYNSSFLCQKCEDMLGKNANARQKSGILYCNKIPNHVQNNVQVIMMICL